MFFTYLLTYLLISWSNQWLYASRDCCAISMSEVWVLQSVLLVLPVTSCSPVAHLDAASFLLLFTLLPPALFIPAPLLLRVHVLEPTQFHVLFEGSNWICHITQRSITHCTHYSTCLMLIWSTDCKPASASCIFGRLLYAEDITILSFS